MIMTSKKPYKDKEKLKKEIENFLEDNESQIYEHGSKISTYFEIACYNYVVKYYEKYGFEVDVKNLTPKGEFKYMLSPTGYPKNFSYFYIKKTYNYKDPTPYEYEIRHNIRVQAETDKDIFVNPDIIICKRKGKVGKRTDPRYYGGRRDKRFIPNDQLVSFMEAKHYNPFPELVLNFVGLVNELKPSSLEKTKKDRPYHIAPSLMVSGKGNHSVKDIKDSFETRYDVNIFLDLFAKPKKVYKNRGNIVRI